MRILCVHQGYELYGSDRSFLSSVRIVREHVPSAEITVRLPQPGPLAEAFASVPDVTVETEPIGIVRTQDVRRPVSSIVRTLRFAAKARRDASKYDALYINTVVVADHLLAARTLRIPAVVHVREIPPSFGSRLALSALLLASGARPFFNSDATRASYLWHARRPSWTIHNGTEAVADAGPIEAGYDVLRVLLIGRINRWKGHRMLIDAVAALAPEDRARLRVRIVGDPPDDQEALRTELEAHIEDRGVTDVVELHPFSASPARHYAWAHVVAVPSTSPEPFGRVAVEAMSAYRVVLAAAHGGLSEIVEDRVTGRTFRPNDVSELSRRLHELIHEDGSRLRTMGIAGRRAFDARFSIEAYRTRFVAALSQAFRLEEGAHGS